MSGNEPSEVERAGLEVVRAVVDVTDHKRLVSSGKTGEKTGDWRVWLNDGRIADVEVTRWTDRDETEFFNAAHEKDDSLREWRNKKLSCRWIVAVSDNPGFNRKRRRLKEWTAELASALAVVEAAGGTPEQMMSAAQAAFEEDLLVLQGYEETVTLTEFAGLQIEDGERSRHVYVGGVPEPVGPGRGAVVVIPISVDSYTGYGEMVEAIRNRIDEKTKKRQLDRAPRLKWLAVMLEDTPGCQLMQYFGPNSRRQPSTLEGISFTYFDEVWAVAREAENFVVLRLSDGGTRQQHHVVSRSQTVASG